MIGTGLRYGVAVVFLGALILAAGCGSDKSTKPSTKTVEAYVTGVSTMGGTVAMKSGNPPAASGGPTVSTGGNTVVINGGSAQVTVASLENLSKVIVGIQGVDGYYEVSLAQARAQVILLLTLAQNIPQSGFTFLYGAADASGKVGAYSQVPVTVTEVGTGDIQVSVSWDKDSDTDLHVVSPGGVEVFYGNPQADNGGKLDLDSNAACSLDHVRNENITWPQGMAPRGTYTVRVDYFAACAVDTTHYVVTVNTGGTSQTFTGLFTGNGDFGGQGSGALVTTFEY